MNTQTKYLNKGHIALISVHGDPTASLGQDGAGGQNVYVRKIGEALAHRGWKIDMFTRCTNPAQPLIMEHFPGCRTIHLTAGLQVYINRDHLFETLPQFVDALLKFQHDQQIIYPLIHTNYWLSSWVGMQLRQKQLTKHIHTYHSLGAIKYRSAPAVPLVMKTRLAVEKDCLETASSIVATSTEEEKDMRAWVSNKGNIDVIPCGVDINNFQVLSRDAARQNLEISSDKQVVLFVGRFDPRKGIKTLLNAVAQMKIQAQKPLQVLLVGGGQNPADIQERQRLEEIIQQKGLSSLITFVGAIDHQQLTEYYTAADVCVIPSHYEPFGLVAVEAMACGTPVIRVM
jgi:D-inositol-3-phosphate glycosyltransferase